MSEESKQLAEISRKLDQLIVLFKLSNSVALENCRRTIGQDKVYIRLLEITEIPLSYSEISKKLHDELGIAEITAKRKIADLKAMGLLISTRKGREVYYENSGILT